jgi:hypothetical protein
VREPLQQKLGVRPTYRTWRVLVAIGELSESHSPNSRQVASRAGIRDEGQASRLLKRLEDHSLIENTGAGHATGECNAWGLTPVGEEVRRVLEGRFGR